MISVRLSPSSRRSSEAVSLRVEPKSRGALDEMRAFGRSGWITAVAARSARWFRHEPATFVEPDRLDAGFRRFGELTDVEGVHVDPL